MKFNTFIKTVFFAFVFVGMITMLLFASENVTVTVLKGSRQTFAGIGAASTNRSEYQQLPQSLRDTMAA
jgi:hypothetical protein